MTPETKAWIEEVKKLLKLFLSEHPDSVYVAKHLLNIDLPKAIQIIEDQAKEIKTFKLNIKQSLEEILFHGDPLNFALPAIEKILETMAGKK